MRTHARRHTHTSGLRNLQQSLRQGPNHTPLTYKIRNIVLPMYEYMKPNIRFTNGSVLENRSSNATRRTEKMLQTHARLKTILLRRKFQQQNAPNVQRKEEERDLAVDDCERKVAGDAQAKTIQDVKDTHHLQNCVQFRGGKPAGTVLRPVGNQSLRTTRTAIVQIGFTTHVEIGETRTK